MTVDILMDRIRAISCPKCSRRIDTSAVEPLGSVSCPSCGTEIRVPARLGPFLLTETLGHGGMGAVYRGRDEALGRDVAIKVMTGSLGRDKTSVQTFQSEAKAAAALNHPNIVQIYAFDEEQGQPYIAMEYISGDRFDRMIGSGEQLDQARVCRIGVDVAEGLKAASDIGIVHGDIKPENILLDKNGTAKVVDFGLAKFVAQQKPKEEGGVWGTPYYIAPEKVRGRSGDLRADIYSLGATLYHALAGVPPFEGETPIEVVKARLEGPALPLKELRKDIHGQLAALIARMLEPEPVRRYPTYTSLLADLRKVLPLLPRTRQAGPVAKSKSSKTGKIVLTKSRDRAPPVVLEPDGARTREPGRGKPRAGRKRWVLLGVVFIAAGVIAAVLVVRGRREQELRRREATITEIAELRQTMTTGVQTIVALATNVAHKAARTESYPEELRAEAERIVELSLLADTVIVETERLQRKNRLLTRMREKAETVRDSAMQEDSLSAVRQGSDELARIMRSARALESEALECFTAADKAYQEAAALRAEKENERTAEGDAARRKAEEEKRRREAEAKKAREAEERLKALVPAELARVSEAVSNQTAAVRKNLFEDALAAFTAELPDLETPEAKQARDRQVQRYERLTELKAFLAAAIRGSANGPLPWEQADIRQMVKLIRRHLPQAEGPPEQKARLALAAAILCTEHGGATTAAAFVDEAVKLDPQIRDEAERLLPELAAGPE